VHREDSGSHESDEDDPVVTGNAAPVVTGDAAPVVTGDADPVVTGDDDPVVTGNAAPVVTGDAAPVVEELDEEELEDEVSKKRVFIRLKVVNSYPAFWQS